MYSELQISNQPSLFPVAVCSTCPLLHLKRQSVQNKNSQTIVSRIYQKNIKKVLLAFCTHDFVITDYILKSAPSLFLHTLLYTKKASQAPERILPKIFIRESSSWYSISVPIWGHGRKYWKEAAVALEGRKKRWCRVKAMWGWSWEFGRTRQVLR